MSNWLLDRPFMATALMGLLGNRFLVMQSYLRPGRVASRSVVKAKS